MSLLKEARGFSEGRRKGPGEGDQGVNSPYEIKKNLSAL